MNPLLIIFYRNPEIGKVKTRLAATIGDGEALGVYLKLVAHTRTITEQLPCAKVVFYSNYIDTEDNWSSAVFQKKLQQGHELGDRMKQAFQQGFTDGFNSICIIGTDCYELTSEIIAEAFKKLKSHDAVMGPAADGGYYLLGMNKLHTPLFKNKQWSTETVARDTLKDFESIGLQYHLLPQLNDVDLETDLPADLKP